MNIQRSSRPLGARHFGILLIMGLLIWLAAPTTVSAASCIWTGNVSRNWHEAGNWESCRGSGGTEHPEPDDAAIISNGSNAPQVSANVTVATIIFNSGTLTIDEGHVVNTNQFEWNSGTIDGLGRLIANNSVLQTTSSKIVNEATLEIANAATWSNGHITVQRAGVILNAEGATFNITNSNRLLRQGTGDLGRFDNNGTVHKVEGSTTTVQVVFNNQGAVSADRALTLARGGTNSGTFDIAETGSVTLSANYRFEAGGEVSGDGDLIVASGVLTIDTAADATRVLNTFDIENLRQTGGTIASNIDVTADAFAWNAGTLTGIGKLTTNELFMDTTSAKIINETLV